MKRLAILLAFAGASAQAQTPPPPAPAAPDLVEQQIVVIGEKLKGRKGSVAKAEGRLVCRTRTSTGDRKLDAIRCGAMLTCVRPLEPQVDELMASDRSSDDKRRAFDRLLVPAKPCMESYEDAAVARLAAERAAS